VFLSASSASASGATKTAGRVTFGIEPASATGPNGRSEFSFGATPGAVLFDHVAVLNYSQAAIALQVYATDAAETSGGGFGLIPAGESSTGVGLWVTLPANPVTVQLPAAKSASTPSQVILPITVRIPANATPGDHSGGIVASLRTVGTNRTGQSIVLNQRVGTQVLILVSGTLAPHLAISGAKAVYTGTVDPLGRGTVRVSYRVTNTGNENLALDQSVALSGWLSSPHKVSLAKVSVLLPGTTISESVTFRHVLPQLRLHEKITVRPLVLQASTSAGLTPGSSLPPVTAQLAQWAIPWSLFVIIVVLIGLIVVAVRRHRHRPPAIGPTGGRKAEPEAKVKA
jgi:hypothetical protein